MANKYYATVLAKGKIVEEELLLLVNGVEVMCFAGYCPERIFEGQSYTVEFDIDLPDADYAVATEIKTTLYEIVGDGFSCMLYGYMDGSIFQSFIEFNDQEIYFDYPELNDKFVKIEVDRINVAFLPS